MVFIDVTVLVKILSELMSILDIGVFNKFNILYLLGQNSLFVGFR